MFENIQLPIILKSDTEYLDVLKETFETLTTELNTLANNNAILDTVKDSTIKNIESINSALSSYFMGDIATAQNEIYELLKKYENNEHLITTANRSYACTGIDAFKENKPVVLNQLSFYRARIGTHFCKEDMGYIPFKKRSLVATQRFSIPGIPCLYLGTSSYACWLELNKPADYLFSVSHYKIVQDLKILDLTMSLFSIEAFPENQRISNLKDIFNENIPIESIEAIFELAPLIIATSFVVQNSDNRNFKIEYTISHLIMNNLTKLKIDGVAFLSKKFKSELFTYPLGVILAFPIFDEKRIQSNIEFNDPINFAEFKMIPSSETKSFSSTYWNSKPYNNDDNVLNLGNSTLKYRELPFHNFDNYVKGERLY